MPALRSLTLVGAVILALLAMSTPAAAQAEGPDGFRGPGGPPGRGGPDGRGRPDGPGGPGGPGGMHREDLKLVEAHDRNGDGWLKREERASARESLSGQRVNRGERRGPRRGGGGPRGRSQAPATPGPRISPDEVEVYKDEALYDVDTLRTLFLSFENDDWEAELEDFHGTDVEVPASLLVDGETYPGVGVRFRGASSYMMVPTGSKRSFNLSLDLVDEDQRLLGHKTLNLLNSAGDPSMMSTVLYSQLAGEHLAVPKANFVKVVINGEYWGVYVNVQQFDKTFTAENFGSSKGTRWKVPGSPRGDGGLAYDGDDLEAYKERYDMKSNDGKKAWNALVELCRVLNETPLDQLVEELEPVLDLDETLWFLAYDVALVNSDGYWTRASDYYLFRDREGRFHLSPHDMNESFRGSGRGHGGGPTLDPLVGLDNERMPLRSRLLQVPELRERYLENLREIARDDLDEDSFGSRVAAHRKLIAEAVAQDTRKLDSTEAFLQATGAEESGRQATDSLPDFARQRRAHLLDESSAKAD